MSMSQIKHVVYYMIENRSFDNLLGWLYDAENPPAHIIANSKQAGDPFYGLEENKYFNCFEGEDSKNYVQKGSSTLDNPSPDPNEAYEHVNNEARQYH